MKKRQAEKIYKRMCQCKPSYHKDPYWVHKYGLYIIGIREDHRIRKVYKILKEKVEAESVEFWNSLWTKIKLIPPK